MLKQIKSFQELESNGLYIYENHLDGKMYLVIARPEKNHIRQVGDLYGENLWYFQDGLKGSLWGPISLEQN